MNAESTHSTTPILTRRPFNGAEGLFLSHDENCLVADDPANFAGCVVSLFGDIERRDRLAAAGMRLIRQQHSMTAARPRIRALYRTLLRSEQ